MNSLQLPNGSPRRTAVLCTVVGLGIVRATPAQLATLRQRPGSIAAQPLPPSFLKHADEQTVAGIAALISAIDHHGLDARAFGAWGVVAASRFMGRTLLASTLIKFRAEGAWGISPHLIPHRSLHALSGTVSLALKLHGPNFGTGGGVGGAAEALRTAAALLHGGQLPGAWVVLTGWDPEPATDRQAQVITPDCVCSAIALALVPGTSASGGLTLRVDPAAAEPHRHDHGPLPSFTFEAMVRALDSPSALPASLLWQLPGGGRMELRRVPAPGPNGSAPHWSARAEHLALGAEKTS